MIEANRLCKYYGSITAIEDVTFSIGQGEIVGFLGPNGAGKTTTMRILTGAILPSSGTARIGGFLVEDQAIEAKRRVGYLPESVPLYPEMLVASYLMYVAEIRGFSGKQRMTEARRVMERCGLSDMGKRMTGNLSKGYRQRVGLAQALIGNPPVLILDEPTEGLDPRQIVEIRRLIKELAQEHTVLLSTHILAEAALICQRVLIINDGRIVAQETLEGISRADGAVMLDIRAEGDRHRIERALTETAGVRHVQAEPPHGYLVEAEGATATRNAIVKALTGAGAALLEMRPRTRTLEEVFIEAVSAGKEHKE